MTTEEIHKNLLALIEAAVRNRHEYRSKRTGKWRSVDYERLMTIRDACVAAGIDPVTIQGMISRTQATLEIADTVKRMAGIR
jgi:hypothetical protein